MESSIIKLPGGRDLGYCLAGAEKGAPFFTFHGLPGSRMESHLLDSAAKKQNVKIITPDRPGYGLSSWQSGRTLLTWSEDVACLADALNIDTFGVIGVSGGAPCALSCAYTMPQRITSIGIVCGLGPLYHTGLSQDMRWLVAAGFNLARQFPWVLKFVPGLPALVLAKTAPGIMLEIIAMVHGGADRQVLKMPNVREKLILNIKEAFRQGTRGAIQDMQLYSRDWGFLLRDISGHVDIWHGDADDIVPVSHGQYLHQHLPDSTFTVLPGQAHFSLPITCADAILATLKD
jgi:pimeloyl-ACP methyl ester carboxylesterase